MISNLNISRKSNTWSTWHGLVISSSAQILNSKINSIQTKQFSNVTEVFRCNSTSLININFVCTLFVRRPFGTALRASASVAPKFHSKSNLTRKNTSKNSKKEWKLSIDELNGKVEIERDGFREIMNSYEDDEVFNFDPRLPIYKPIYQYTNS